MFNPFVIHSPYSIQEVKKRLEAETVEFHWWNYLFCWSCWFARTKYFGKFKGDRFKIFDIALSAHAVSYGNFITRAKGTEIQLFHRPPLPLIFLWGLTTLNYIFFLVIGLPVMIVAIARCYDQHQYLKKLLTAPLTQDESCSPLT